MVRHGDAEEQIASRLGLPRNEVALVVKVHKLAANGPRVGTAAVSQLEGLSRTARDQLTS
jgi:hypothetical protein